MRLPEEDVTRRRRPLPCGYRIGRGGSSTPRVYAASASPTWTRRAWSARSPTSPREWRNAPAAAPTTSPSARWTSGWRAAGQAPPARPGWSPGAVCCERGPVAGRATTRRTRATRPATPLTSRSTDTRVADLARDVDGEVVERGGQPRGVILCRDPVGHPLGPNLDERASVRLRHLPCHRHRPREGRILGDEVDRLHEAPPRHEVHDPRVDDIGVPRGLPGPRRRVVENEHHAVRAAGTNIGVLEATRHAGRRQPRQERVRVDEG